LVELFQFLAFEGRDTAAARDAFLVGKLFGHFNSWNQNRD
jgi:hypothetical protein